MIHLGVFLPDLAIIDAEWHCWGFAATRNPTNPRENHNFATRNSVRDYGGIRFRWVGHKKSKKEWSAEIGQSQVTIKHEGKTVSVVRTGLPNVEETRFLEQDGRKMLAVKLLENTDRRCCNFSTSRRAH